MSDWNSSGTTVKVKKKGSSGSKGKKTKKAGGGKNPVTASNRTTSTSLTALLSPQQADEELQAATRLKYRPVEQQYKQQLGVSDVMQGRIDDWYTKYQQAVRNAQTRSQGIYAGAEKQVQDFTRQGQNTDAYRQAMLNNQQQADAQKRGATVDPRNAQIAALAQSARRRGMESGLQNLTAHGAANTTFLSNQRRNVQGQRLQAHMDEAGRARLLRKGLMDLAQQKGDFKVAYRGTLRGNERNYKLGLDTLKLNSQKAAQAAAASSASLALKSAQFSQSQALKDAKYKLDLKKFGSKVAKDNYQRRHHLGPYKKSKGSKGKKSNKGPSHAVKASARNQLGKARALLAAATKNPGQSASIAVLLSHGISDSDIALAAYQLKYFHGVGPHTRKALYKKYRIKLSGFPHFPSGGTTGGR